jgi:hypothetical protein
MNISSILDEVKNLNEEEVLLLESGIRIPPGTKSFKILHHDDSDGLGSAKMARQQIQNQMFKQFKKENPGKSDKEIKKLIDDRIVTKTVTDRSKPNEVANKLKKDPNQMILVVDFDRFDKFGDKVKNLIKNGAINFHSDHHQTETPMTKGGGKTGATDYRSDTEHLATKTLSKPINPKTVLAFSNTDSATFLEDIKKELGIEKSTNKEARVLRELFTFLSQITRSKEDRKAQDYFIKNSGNSIYSMYSYAKKLKRAMDLKDKGIEEFKKDTPDMKVVDKVRNELIKIGFKDFATDVKKGARTKNIKNTVDMAKKAKEDYANKEKLYKGLSKYVVLSNLAGKGQPSRYLGFAIPTGDKDSEKYLSMIRNWDGMGFIQASLSPEAPKEVKDAIDLPAIFKRALGKTKKKFGNKYNDWAFDIIDKESGGHKGIANAGGFGTLGLMPKKFREELKSLKPMLYKMNKIKSIKGNSKAAKAKKAELLSKMPEFKKKLDRIEELENMKKKYSVKKNKIMADFRNELNTILNYEIEEALKKKEKIKNESFDLKGMIINNSK